MTDLPLISLDTTGLICPEPLMMLHQAIRRAAPGQQIKIIATDPSTRRDIPKFCLHLGHRLVQAPTDDSSPDDILLFIIEKKLL